MANAADRDPAEVMEKQKIILHINEEIADTVLDDFLTNNFYGFNLDNVFFIIQRLFGGFALTPQGVEYVPDSPQYPYGHGDAIMQLNQQFQAFRLSRNGRREYIEQPLLEYLEQIGHKIKIIESHRVNDLPRYLPREVVNIQKLAFKLYLFDQGCDIVGEFVANPNKQTGGNLLQDTESSKKIIL